MGLYDGEPSTADLSATFGLPVVVVIDANAMAQTFGAVAKGLKEYRPVPFAGVIANRVAGSQHAHMLAQRPAFATFPRLEIAFIQQLHSLNMLARLIEKGA